MIYAAWFIAGVLFSSVCWLLILGLCLSAKDRDELEARSYDPLLLKAGALSINEYRELTGAPPLPPSWVNNGDDAA